MNLDIDKVLEQSKEILSEDYGRSVSGLELRATATKEATYKVEVKNTSEAWVDTNIEVNGDDNTLTIKELSEVIAGHLDFLAGN